MAFENNRPGCRVTLDGTDLTDKIRPRLVSLRIREKRGEEADQLDITLDDSDGKMAIPKPGATIRVQIGWEKGSSVTMGLVDKGTFKVDEVSHDGPPDTITIRARSADFTSAIRRRRDKSWRDTTLGQVLRDVASNNGLTANIASQLASVPLKLVAQSRESDIALLKRLGREHDAVATIKDKKLIFAPIGSGTTATGVALPIASIRRSDGDRHTYKIEKREEYSGVTASWHDTAAAKRCTLTVGADDNPKSLKKVYPSEAEARRAAEAEHGRLGRAPAKLSLSLALGQPNLYPEQKAKALGFKNDIDATEWLIVDTTHELSSRGLSTSLELETSI